MESTGIGARFALATTTSNVWVTLSPSGSVAMTVTVAVPAATGTRVSSLAETRALTTPESLELAV